MHEEAREDGETLVVRTLRRGNLRGTRDDLMMNVWGGREGGGGVEDRARAAGNKYRYLSSLVIHYVIQVRVE